MPSAFWYFKRRCALLCVCGTVSSMLSGLKARSLRLNTFALFNSTTYAEHNISQSLNWNYNVAQKICQSLRCKVCNHQPNIQTKIATALKNCLII